MGPLVGQPLAVYGGRLIGWTLDLDDPGRTLELILDIDGKDQPIRHRADATLPLAVPRADIVGHGFSIPLLGGSIVGRPARRLWSYLRSPAARRYGVRSADGLTLAHSLVLPPAGATLASMGIEGFCDASDDGVFKGWAWRPAEIDTRVDIAVFVDGKFLARVTASRYREDVHNLGRGDGEYGFDVAIPEQLRGGGRHRVEAIVADIGLPLSRSPLWIEGSRLDFKAKKKG